MWRKPAKYYLCLLLLSSIGLFYACNLGESEYTRTVRKELATGKRSDSLFLGLYLGMSSKAFYGHCWELNKKGMLTNGSDNTTVLFKVDTGLNHRAAMNFYPDFDEDKIFRMRVSFQYSAWAPWNRTLYADSLFPDVLRMYRRWYPEGNDFLTLTDKVKGTIYVKVDGNRRITIGKFSDAVVKVDYTDLLIEEKQKK